MSTETSINKFSLPTLDDVPNIETAVHSMANSMDGMLVPRFTTTSDRGTKMPTPNAGQMCYVSGTKELYVYTGTAWIGSKPRFARKTADESFSDETSWNEDDHLKLPIESNSRYTGKFVIFTDATTDNTDIDIAFSGPTGISGYCGVHDVDDVTALDGHFGIAYKRARAGFGTSLTPLFRVGSGDVAVVIYAFVTFTTSSTSGTLKFHWSPSNAGDGQTVFVRAGSWFRLWKVG